MKKNVNCIVLLLYFFQFWSMFFFLSLSSDCTPLEWYSDNKYINTFISRYYTCNVVKWVEKLPLLRSFAFPRILPSIAYLVFLFLYPDFTLPSFQTASLLPSFPLFPLSHPRPFFLPSSVECQSLSASRCVRIISRIQHWTRRGRTLRM